jgi:hypothetical protein
MPAKIQKVPASSARTLAHFINAWSLAYIFDGFTA